MDLANKTVVVTGGGRGMGEHTARAFMREGANVAVLDTDASAGAAVAREAGERGLFIQCDVSNADQVADAFARIEQTFGGVDFLINNAGILRYSTVTETTDEEWDQVIGVNLKSAFLCARAALPSMQKRGGGVVVNMSSVQAFLSQQRVGPYTTAKTALLGLTRSIAVDYAPTIRCVAVCPGTVDTPMLQDAIEQSPDPDEVRRECEDMHPLKRVGKPQEIAELIVFICSDKAPFITGQAIRIDGGLGIAIGGSKRDA